MSQSDRDTQQVLSTIETEPEPLTVAKVLRRRHRPPGTLDAPYQRESFVSRFKMGILTASTVTAAMNLLYIKKGIGYACAVTLWLMGWETKPPSGEERPGFFVRAEEQAKKAAHRYHEDDIHPPTRTGILGTAVKSTIHQTKEVVSDGVDTLEKKAEPVKKEMTETFRNLNQRLGRPPIPPEPPTMPGLRGHMAAPITESGGLPPGMVSGSPPPGGFMRGVQNFGNSAVDLVRSASAGAADAHADQVLYRQWWAEACPYAGRCPSGHPMILPARAHKNYCCLRCGKTSSHSAALIRSKGRPGPPSVRPREFYAWKERLDKNQAEEAKVTQ